MKDLAPLPTKNDLVEDAVKSITTQWINGNPIGMFKKDMPSKIYDFVVERPDYTKPHDLNNLNRVQIYVKPLPVVTEVSGSLDGSLVLSSDVHIPTALFKIERLVAISNIPSVLDLPMAEGEEPKQELAISISFETKSDNPEVEFSKSVTRHYISTEAMAKKAIRVTYRDRNILVKDVMNFLNDGIKPPQS